jgi:hypothetical protein
MLSPERLEFVKNAIDGGIFIKVAFKGWNGRVSWHSTDSCGVKEIDYRKIGVTEISGVNYINRIMGLLLKDYTYRTPYGIFVPASNIDVVLNRLAELRDDLFVVRDKVVANSESIKKTIRKKLVPVMKEKWVSLGNVGEPTIGFVEEEVSAYIGRIPLDKEKADKRFKLSVFPFNPILPDGYPCGGHIDIENHNMSVMRSVYDSILSKRVSLVNVCGHALENLSLNINWFSASKMCKPMFRKMAGYRNGLFYDDPELKRLISDFMDMTILSASEHSPEEFMGVLTAIKSHLVNHKFFLVGLYVGRK